MFFLMWVFRVIIKVIVRIVFSLLEVKDLLWYNYFSKG